MKELLQQILDHLRGMWHRRWVGLAVAWAVAVVGLVVVYRIPERYEATARVYVDTETLLKPLLAGLAIQPNVDQQVALMTRTLISRPNVEKVIRMADLDLTVKTNSERDDLIDNVMKTIHLTGGAQTNQTNLYVIDYRDPDPVKARKVVQSLLTIFVDSSLGDNRQDTQTAVKFVNEQIKRYEQNLKAAEDRLKEFKIKYMSVSGREGPDYFTRLSQTRSAIDNARLELQAAQQSRDAYRREVSGETPTLLPDASDAGSREAVPEIDTRIATLKHNLDELLRKYTDQHPDVVGTMRVIANLEDQRREVIAARRKAAAGRPVTMSAEQSPVFQQLRVSLADAEAAVASAQAKLTGYEAQYRALQSQAQLVPQVEAEYSQLNRDYDVQKKTYENLLSRREAAGMGMGVQDTGGAQFRVIDPPRVSPQPVAPNRIALLGVAGVLSLFAGLLASFVTSQVLPIFHDARALREVTKRPILGMVSLLPSEALVRFRRRNAYLFAAALGGLMVGYSAIVVVAAIVGRVA